MTESESATSERERPGRLEEWFLNWLYRWHALLVLFTLGVYANVVTYTVAFEVNTLLGFAFVWPISLAVLFGGTWVASERIDEYLEAYVENHWGSST